MTSPQLDRPPPRMPEWTSRPLTRPVALASTEPRKRIDVLEPLDPPRPPLNPFVAR